MCHQPRDLVPNNHTDAETKEENTKNANFNPNLPKTVLSVTLTVSQAAPRPLEGGFEARSSPGCRWDCDPPARRATASGRGTARRWCPKRHSITAWPRPTAPNGRAHLRAGARRKTVCVSLCTLISLGNVMYSSSLMAQRCCRGNSARSRGYLGARMIIVHGFALWISAIAHR